ncbi:MAG: efflux RND transporter periplasmic adaptor subunit [Proteobacteria bacterium]|nr:efflux RND transporter periplasmic adaptor subunit [Pseudomonadota bacterium]
MSDGERMKRSVILVLAVVGLVVLIGGVKGYSTYKMVQGFKAQGAPKFTVSTAKAQYQDWLPQLSAVGSLRAERGADLSAEVDGTVDAIEFRSGDYARAGQLLVRLRSADEAAKLESLKANAVLAEVTARRDQAQFEAQAISQATLDADAANLRSAKAQVVQQQALLDKKFVRAPFAGQLGIRAVDLGQYLSAGTKIVTLQQLDPIFVDFSLPQQAVSELQVGQKTLVSSDALPGKSFEGQIVALDPQVDPDTRNVRVRAMLKNPEHKLLPGMFANVRIEVGAPVRYLTLPQTAVAYNPYGSTVYVIGKAGPPPPAEGGKPPAVPPPPADALVAHQVFVTTGATRGDQVAILTGVKEGDEIVTSGQIKLRNGAQVTVNNAVQPANDPDPKLQVK